MKLLFISVEIDISITEYLTISYVSVIIDTFFQLEKSRILTN